MFIGAYATNPVTGEQIPVFIADYVLMGYGTGAIMAVPGSGRARLGVRRGLRPADRPHRAADRGLRRQGVHRRRPGDQLPVDGLAWTAWTSPRPRRRSSPGWRRTGTAAARSPTGCATGCSRRQRYWGEPFPIVYDETGAADRAARVDAAGRAARDRRLLAEDVRPRRRRHRRRRPPLGAADATGSRSSWTWATGRSATAARRTRCRSGPARAGTSCATWTRPTPSGSSTPRSSTTGWARAPTATAGRRRPVRRRRRARRAAPAVRAVLAQGAVRPGPRVVVRAVPPAVQPGHASRRTRTPTRAASTCRPRRSSSATARYYLGDTEVNREYGKMGKSLKNVVTPDDMYAAYGADTFRVYEMSMGPLEQSRPWETRAVVGSYRFLQRVWRVVVDEQTGALRVTDDAGRRGDSPAAAQDDRRGPRRHGRRCGSTPRSPS